MNEGRCHHSLSASRIHEDASPPWVSPFLDILTTWKSASHRSIYSFVPSYISLTYLHLFALCSMDGKEEPLTTTSIPIPAPASDFVPKRSICLPSSFTPSSLSLCISVLVVNAYARKSVRTTGPYVYTYNQCVHRRACVRAQGGPQVSSLQAVIFS